MNPIHKALSEVKYVIPKAVLEKTFLNRHQAWRQPVETNLDQQITSLVIRPRVLVDCNIVGGTQAMIPISDLPYEQPDGATTVMRIPKSHTQGRTINSVLHVAFLSSAQNGTWNAASSYSSSLYNSSENSATMGAAEGVMAALDKIPVTSTASVQLIGENVIMVKDVMNLPSNSYLRCILTNDDNLSNIQIRSYPAFSRLVEFAVKSYIYNSLVIEIDMAELQGGYNLGVFKTVIESYSDAEQNYQDFLRDKWQAVAVMNDATTYRRLLKLAIGGHR
jgi:hypothetical protein